MNTKLALIPLLGVLFTMAPLAAFADTPTVTFPSSITPADTIKNFDDNNGDGALDWTCSGPWVDYINNLAYVLQIYDQYDNPTAFITSCSETNRLNALGSFEGQNEGATFYYVIYEDNAWSLSDTYNGGFVAAASTTAPWYVTSGSVDIVHNP